MSMQYYLREYTYSIFAFVLALLLAAFILRKQIIARFEFKRLKRQVIVYNELIEKADRDFVESIITREEFNRITTKYNAELAATSSKIAELEEKKHAKKK